MEIQHENHRNPSQCVDVFDSFCRCHFHIQLIRSFMSAKLRFLTELAKSLSFYLAFCALICIFVPVMSKQNLSQYDIIRQLRLSMIVLVTFAHSYGKVADDYSLLFSEFNTYEFLKLLVSQTLVKVAVPGFFIISGYLFFANVSEWNLAVYKQKMLRRVKTLLLPYLIWNLLMAIKLKTFSWSMFWAYISKAGMQTDWLGCENWMTAPANMPLWFLRDLMVVSLLTPIIYVVLRRWGRVVIPLLTLIYLSGIGAFAVPGLSMYAVYFFSLGAFLAIRKQDLVETMLRFETPAYISASLLAVAMVCTYHTAVFSSLMLCFRIVGAVAVFCLAQRILSRSCRRLPAVVCDSSYFIYLAHYVFFLSFLDTAFFRLFGESEASLSIHYLLFPLLKVALFVAVYAIYRRFSKKK